MITINGKEKTYILFYARGMSDAIVGRVCLGWRLKRKWKSSSWEGIVKGMLREKDGR